MISFCQTVRYQIEVTTAGGRCGVISGFRWILKIQEEYRSHERGDAKK